MQAVPGQRIAILGTSGAGKTTMARCLAARLHLPHIELDSLYWGPNWTEADPDRFRGQVDTALTADRWVVDGNYSAVRGLIWTRADTLVWLDYSLPLVLQRLTRRSIRRLALREELWNGNRERLRELVGPNGLYVWAIQSHTRHRRQFERDLAAPEHTHLTLIRLRTPAQARRWLATVQAAQREPI
jgi:adenylate kinase family enzyme